ncbi:MAG: hypothetical protein CGW95_04785 [Phenylobacterium zucineum]|nr:MAG: hypothetical protein CGW95_04785 [Phenylobacterium zucineum]
MAKSNGTNPHIQIEVGMDATPVEQGAQKVGTSIDQMADKVSQASGKASKSLNDLGDVPTKAADQMTRAERSMVQSIERATAAFSAGSKSSSDYYRVLAQQRGIDPAIIAPYLDALDKVAPKQKAVKDAVDQTVPSMQKYEMSAKATAAALRNVPAQMTDIVVGLQGGQAPLTVLLQQGGQLKDMFGGVVPAVKAIGGYILDMVNPLTLTVAAAATLGYAFYSGRKEAQEFNKALILTNDYAGQSAGSLGAMAMRISQMSGATQGAAAQALAALAGSGQITGDNLERMGLVAVKVHRETGAAVADVVKQFEDLARDPIATSQKLNSTMHYLTVEMWDQIKALEDQGKHWDAVKLAQKAFADASSDNMDKLKADMGTLETATRDVGDWFKAMWDKVLNIGRQETPETKLQGLKDQLAQMIKDSGGTGKVAAWWGGESKANELRAQIEQLQLQVDLQAKLKSFDTEDAKTVQLKMEFDAEHDKYLGKEIQMKKELAALDGKFKDRIGTPGFSQKDYNETRAGIIKKFTDTGEEAKKAQLDKARAAFAEGEIRAGYDAQARAMSDGEKVLDALRSAGVVSEQDYYDSKRAILAAQAKLAEDSFTAEIAREDKRSEKGATALDVELIREDKKKRIFDLEQQRQKAREGAVSALILLNLQETASLAKIQNAYIDLNLAAEKYFETTVQGHQRELRAQSQGTAQNSRDAGINQINDKYAEMRNQAAGTYIKSNHSAEAAKAYLEELSVIQKFQDASLAEWTDYYDKLKSGEADWTNGAKRALDNYLDDVNNVAKASESVFTNAFKTMEDALTNWAMTGQISSKQLADQIISDLIRIQIRANVVGPLAGMIKSFGFADGGVMTSNGPMPLQKYATGGVATSPQVAVFGEGSMNEAFVPLPDGKRIPVAMQGGAGSVIINQPLNISAPNANAQTVAQIQAMMPAMIAQNAKVVEGVIRQAMTKRAGRFA